MNKALWFVLGAVIGAASGYLIAETLVAEKIQKKANEDLAKQIADLEDFYKKRDEARQKAHELNELKEEFVMKEIEREQAKATQMPVDYTSPQRKQKKEEPKEWKEEYDEWGNSKRPKGAPRRAEPPEIDYGGPEYDSEDGAKIYPSEPDTEPHVISEDSFEDDCPHYEKMTLFWFMPDNVVTDDEYQPLEDLALIGDDWSTHFGQESDPDVVHVRNPKVACDYEIIRQTKSYASITQF